MRLKPASFKRDITVSIHASVKDATATGVKIRGYVVVSIHASVKDATTFTTDDTRATRFQSTHL